MDLLANQFKMIGSPICCESKKSFSGLCALIFSLDNSPGLKKGINLTLYGLSINGQCGEQTDKLAFTVVRKRHLVLGGTTFSFCCID